MKNFILAFAVFIASLAVSAPAHAQYSYAMQARFFATPFPMSISNIDASKGTGVVLNAPMTFDPIPVAGMTSVTIFIKAVDDNASMTGASMTCSVQPLNSTDWYPVQACSGTTCASIDAQWTKAMAGSKNWPWTVDIPPSANLQCTMPAFTGAGSGDKGFFSAVGAVQ
jgi:hypothetical protein